MKCSTTGNPAGGLTVTGNNHSQYRLKSKSGHLTLVLLVGCWLGLLALDAAGQSLVTQRFGEAVTCDVTGVTRDTTVNKSDPNSAGGAAKTHYYRAADHGILIYFDLSAIPRGKVVRKAVLRLFYDTDYFDGGRHGISKQLLAITDPDGTGLWDEATASYNYKRSGVRWQGSSNIEQALGAAIGTMYFKNWKEWSQGTLEADITSASSSGSINPRKTGVVICPATITSTNASPLASTTTR